MNNKSDPIFGLEKVPDSELIKRLKYELGVLHSEYQELQDQTNHPQAENTAYIKSMEGQVRNLKAKIEVLEANGFKFELEKSKEKNIKLKRENNALRTQLLKHLNNIND